MALELLRINTLRPWWTWLATTWSRWVRGGVPLPLDLASVQLPVVEEPELEEEFEIDTPAEPESELDEDTPEEAPPSTVAPRARRPRISAPRDVTWHFRSTILDRLDEYFVCIRGLQRHDPDSYALFSRVGFAVPADAYINPDHPANRAKLATTRPISFGGILCGGFTEHTDDCQPSFAYFQKIRRPIGVQANGGAVYRLTCLYDDRRRARRWATTLRAPVSCHVSIRPDGSITLLRERVHVCAPIVSNSTNGRRRYRFTLGTTQWAYPEWLRDVSSEQKSAEDWATDLFVMAFLTHAEAVSRIVVRAAHEGAVAAFGIDVSRAKYFFRDRDVELAADGRKKRIFHSVVEHTRQLRADRSTTVRSHYRGLRTFTWNTYAIHIVLPTNTRVLAFDSPCREFEEQLPADEAAKWFDSRQVGEKFAEVLSR